MTKGDIVMRGPYDVSCFSMVRCKESGEVYVEGCGRWSVHGGLLDVAWFCVCKLGGSLVGRMNVGWVVVGESASALGDRRVRVIRAVSMHYITVV